MRSHGPSTGSDCSVMTGQPRGGSRASSAIEMQERERVRIGFDLHDGPAQTMSAALLQVRMLQDLSGAELDTGLLELRGTITAALEEIYELIEALGGRGAAGDDLAARVRSCVEAFTTRSGIPVAVEIDGDAGQFSASLQIATTRIVQEALSNVHRHAGASHVDVKLDMSSPSAIACSIADDGKGFSVDEALTSRRGREPFGLRSMTERARLLDGECMINSAPGDGTEIRFEIPVWRA